MGIKAFTVGGSFSTIINTMLPVASGVGISKEKVSNYDIKEILDPEVITEKV